MRFPIIIFTLLSAQVYAAYKAPGLNDTYIEHLINALNAANFTALGSAIQSISNTTEGTDFLATLPGKEGRPRVLLAPVNDAFASVPEEVSRNATLMVNTLRYHVTDREPRNLSKFPEHDFFGTLYARPQHDYPLGQSVLASLVNDTEGKERIGIPYQNGGMAYADVFPLDIGVWNMIVHPIDSVLVLPQGLDRVAKAHAPAFANAMEQAGLMGFYALGGMTMFVPEDAAWQSAAGWVGALSPDRLRAVLSHHFANTTELNTRTFDYYGNKVYSEAGQYITLSRNDTGYYVSSNLTTAKVVKTDVPVANGVLHVIDRVLMMNEVATDAVSSAVGTRFLPSGNAGWILAMSVTAVCIAMI